MWLLLVVGFAIGGGPDFAFSEPIEEAVESLDACEKRVKEMADEAGDMAKARVELIYYCVGPSLNQS